MEESEKNNIDFTEKKISIIPIEFYESNEYVYPPFLSETHTQEIYESEAEPGWKYVNVQLGLKNDTGEFIDINDVPFLENKEEIKLTTEQGWTYSLSEDSYDSFFPLLGNKFEENFYKIPGNFTIVGSYFKKNSIGYYYLRFKVAEKSSDYKLILPGYPEIDLSKINNNVILPTSLPDSSFNSFGDNLPISNKGFLIVEDFKIDPISEEAIINATINNASEGYGQEFNLNFFIIGNDGILRAPETYKNENSNYPIEIGPGQSHQIGETFSIKEGLKNLKLIITGDMEAVINLFDKSQENLKSTEAKEIIFNPIIVGTADVPFGPFSSGDLVVKEDYVYLLNKDLKILDISQKENPKILSSLDFIGSEYEESIPNNIFFLDNYVYLTCGINGLKIIDVSDRTNPKIVSDMLLNKVNDSNEAINNAATSVFVSGNYAYVTTGIIGLKIIDLSNKTNPIIVSSLDYKDYINGSWAEVFIEGNYAYVTGYGGLLIIDILNIEEPKLVSYLKTAGGSIFAKDKFVFIGSGGTLGGYIDTIDTYFKENPKVINTVLLPDTVSDIFFDGKYLYACCQYGGFSILDASDKKNLLLLFNDNKNINIAEHLYIEKNFAYITDSYNNKLVIMKLY